MAEYGGRRRTRRHRGGEMEGGRRRNRRRTTRGGFGGKKKSDPGPRPPGMSPREREQLKRDMSNVRYMDNVINNLPPTKNGQQVVLSTTRSFYDSLNRGEKALGRGPR
jgi:hypothetical protein